MESASLRYGPAMDHGGPFSLGHPFERHLRAKNLSDGTVASYLVGVRQFAAFLGPRGRELEEATRADLEAFIAELLSRRSPATASTRNKQLQALYRWLEDEEIAVNPMTRMKPPMVPDRPIPVMSRTPCGGCWPPAPGRALRPGSGTLVPSRCNPISVSVHP
jgi:integrase/recombinase XerC